MAALESHVMQLRTSVCMLYILRTSEVVFTVAPDTCMLAH